MAEIGLAASVIAVIDLSAKVTSWCSEYYANVENAKDDIERLQGETKRLKETLEHVQSLCDSPNGAKLQASQHLRNGIKDCETYLIQLGTKLEPQTRQKVIRRNGIRALRWSLTSNEVDRTIKKLGKCRDNISFHIQAQAYVNNHPDPMVAEQSAVMDSSNAEIDDKEHGFRDTTLTQSEAKLSPPYHRGVGGVLNSTAISVATKELEKQFYRAASGSITPNISDDISDDIRDKSLQEMNAMHEMIHETFEQLDERLQVDVRLGVGGENLITSLQRNMNPYSGGLVEKGETHMERKEDMPREIEIEEDVSSLGSMLTQLSQHVEREEDMPREIEIEEDVSSVGSMPTDKSTASGFSRPVDHTSSLHSGYTSIESRTDNRIDHNEFTSRDEQFLEDVEEEEEEEDGISQKSVGSFRDVASSKGESLIGSDIQKFAQSLILEVLEEDEVLNPLVRESLSKFKRDRVINNLAGFINGYCVLLSGSQPTLNQKRTIRHFRRRSRQFASLVCENLDPSRLELQRNNSEDKSRAQQAERNARIARFLSDGSSDASPPSRKANYDGNEYDHESWSDSEGLPPVLEDIKIFLTNGEALKLFRQHFASFVAGESIKEWNSMIEYRLRLQKGTDEKKALPSPFYFHQPKNTHDIIELDNGQGFQVSWRCRCSRRFQARIPGSERQAAEEFCQRMDWNSKRDGQMVTHCFNLRWLEDLLWALAPNILSRFSFESSGNGAEAGDLETGHGPDPVEPIPNSPDRGSQSIGTQTVQRLISDNTENDMVYICFFRRTNNEWRLKHAKITRNSIIDSSEMREAVHGVDSQNMDKALFLALRERIVRSWKGISWFNPMIIKGLEFWEFKLYHTANVKPVERDKLPYETKYDETESPDANAVLALEEWEYTHLTGQRLSVYKEFLDSEYLLHLLKFPEDAHSTSPVWEGLPRKIRTKLINRQPTPKIGWGFSIQHEWNSIAFTVAVCPIILVGFIMATYLSIKYEWPTSTRIALATGIVTLVTFINTMLGAITKQKGISK